MEIKKAKERRIYLLEYHKKQRDERVKKGLCAECGKKPKPIIPYRCKSCNDRQNARKDRRDKS